MLSMSEVLKFLGVGVLGITLSVEGLCWLYHRLKPTPRVTEVLFFPCQSRCTEGLFTAEEASGDLCPCGVSHGVWGDSFSRLLSHVLSARVSLDVCVFSFSHLELGRAVLLLHARGVCVRIITDRDYQATTGSQIGALRKAGICVRHELSRAVHMHHKFALVDGRLLLSGSLNWTLTAVQSNQENVLVTDEPAIVAPYRTHFQRLWEANDPARHKHTPAAANDPACHKYTPAAANGHARHKYTPATANDPTRHKHTPAAANDAARHKHTPAANGHAHHGAPPTAADDHAHSRALPTIANGHAHNGAPPTTANGYVDDGAPPTTANGHDHHGALLTTANGHDHHDATPTTANGHDHHDATPTTANGHDRHDATPITANGHVDHGARPPLPMTTPTMVPRPLLLMTHH